MLEGERGYGGGVGGALGCGRGGGRGDGKGGGLWVALVVRVKEGKVDAGGKKAYFVWR